MRRATRETGGRASLRSCSRLPCNSGDWNVSPVIFPPGRAMLATNPALTGSAIVGMTIGIVPVARWAAYPAGLFAATMTSTLRRTTSAANSGNRSVVPPPQRHSTVMFLAFDVAEVTQPLEEDIRGG